MQSRRFWIVCPLALAVASCEYYDRELLERGTGMVRDAGAPDESTRSAAEDATTQPASPGFDAMIPEIPGCIAAISDDSDCPVRCPESCNGEDDDCDRALDEDARGELCTLENALGTCAGGSCAIARNNTITVHTGAPGMPITNRPMATSIVWIMATPMTPCSTLRTVATVRVAHSPPGFRPPTLTKKR